MKSQYAFIVLSVLFTGMNLCAKGSAVEAKHIQKKGWIVLFDGTDLDEWSNYQSEEVSPQWVIEDGALVLSGKAG